MLIVFANEKNARKPETNFPYNTAHLEKMYSHAVKIGQKTMQKE